MTKIKMTKIKETAKLIMSIYNFKPVFSWIIINNKTSIINTIDSLTIFGKIIQKNQLYSNWIKRILIKKNIPLVLFNTIDSYYGIEPIKYIIKPQHIFTRVIYKFIRLEVINNMEEALQIGKKYDYYSQESELPYYSQYFYERIKILFNCKFDVSIISYWM